jgi:predicted nucleotidyltransferase
MPDTVLREELITELACMRQVVEQVEALRAGPASGGDPGSTVTAAAALFLSQFYMGVENVLKRICRSRGVSLPAGPNWHVALLDMFRPGAQGGCPGLVGGDLYADLDLYRRYRHMVVHSYSYRLVWSKLVPGLDAMKLSFERFESALREYLEQADAPGVREESAVPYGTPRAPVYLSQAELAALADIKARVSALFPVREYILYGSKARGDFGPDSDVDLLIVTIGPLPMAGVLRISDVVTEANLACGTEFSAVGVSAAEWDSQRYRGLSIRKAVDSEGVPV